MKVRNTKIALKNTNIYIILLVILSMTIAYITFLISMNVKYAIDGVLFHNYNEIPIYMKKIFKQNYIYDLFIIAFSIILLNFTEKLLKYFRDRVTTKFKLKININLKSNLFKHLLNLEYDSYHSYDKAEIMQRINEDADTYSKFFDSQFNIILDVFFLSVIIIKEGIQLNLAISTYIFLAIVVMLLFSLWYFKKLGMNIDNMIFKRKKLLNATIYNMNNFKFIRMFNKQKQEKENYKLLNDDYCNEEIKFIRFVLFYDITLEHLTYLKTPIIYLLGGIAIINGKMTMGSLVAMLNMAERIFDCIYALGSKLEIIDDFYVVSKKINKLLELKEENKGNDSYNLDGNIIFHNVSIYVNNQMILKNINFIINKGEKVAIIGENGSGKSIIAKTILGFYQYDGNIYIHNHNIKRLNKEDIRKYVELILGESYMFSGSILENIKLDNDVDLSIVKEASTNCDIAYDIDNFKEGYQTLIGEKGVKLSGGQKQRICLARSLVSNKPILILDESLNKLDNKTRDNILSNLKNKYNDRIMIFISNDLEIIDYVDKIIYIDEKTTLTGKHKELLANNQNYRNLIKIKEDII